MMSLNVIKSAYASVEGGNVDTSAWRPENFKGLINVTVQTLFVLGGVFFVIMFLYGALRYITSSGDQKALDGAKKTLTGAFVGVLIMAMVYTSSVFLRDVFGVPTFGGIINLQSLSGGSGGKGPGDGGGGGDDDSCVINGRDFAAKWQCWEGQTSCLENSRTLTIAVNILDYFGFVYGTVAPAKCANADELPQKCEGTHIVQQKWEKLYDPNIGGEELINTIANQCDFDTGNIPMGP